MTIRNAKKHTVEYVLAPYLEGDAARTQRRRYQLFGMWITPEGYCYLQRGPGISPWKIRTFRRSITSTTAATEQGWIWLEIFSRWESSATTLIADVTVSDVTWLNGSTAAMEALRKVFHLLRVERLYLDVRPRIPLYTSEHCDCQHWLQTGQLMPANATGLMPLLKLLQKEKENHGHDKS